MHFVNPGFIPANQIAIFDNFMMDKNSVAGWQRDDWLEQAMVDESVLHGIQSGPEACAFLSGTLF
jgi:hypothetical protein